MSTRSIVARPTEAGWEGVYVHSDGMPTSHGPVLLDAQQAFFADNPAGLADFLLSHPAGWSSLGNCDPSNPDIGYADYSGSSAFDFDTEEGQAAYKAYADTPRCYCHGNRSEPSNIYTQEHQGDCWDIEWFYLIDDTHLRIFEGCKEMTPVGVVEWANPGEPNWERMECGENYEHCCHYAWYHFEEAKGTQVNTAKWLGHEPLEIGDEVGYTLTDGTVVQKGGEGHAEGYMRDILLDQGDFARAQQYKGERRNGTRWMQSVVFPDGTKKSIGTYFQRGPRKGQWCSGIEPVWPLIPERAPA